MSSRNRLFAVVTLPVCATILVVGGWWTRAGDLNPPVGPVTGTMKTMGEVEPRTAVSAANTPGDADSLYKITAPGSYYLSGNINAVAGKSGVEIAAHGVTLDLNGFDMLGIPGSLDGICTTVIGLRNLAVLNGSIRTWGGDGVDIQFFVAINCRVEGVRTLGNAGSGIAAGIACTVLNCLAYQNTGTGIQLGVAGICANCTAHANTGDGIQCETRCTIRGNTCFSNGNGAGDGAGILAGDLNRIEGNNCTGADRGIDVAGTGNLIITNTCSGNTSNWEIAVGNSLGPIVVTGVNVAPIAGLGPVPSTLASADPYANFSY